MLAAFLPTLLNKAYIRFAPSLLGEKLWIPLEYMPDLLVNLLKLPPLEPAIVELDEVKVVVRRAQPFEITSVRAFVERNFSLAWADEISVGFAHKPVSVFIATTEKDIVGFAAYECTRRNFFGPTGVIEKVQRLGVGKALLLACLWGLRDMGYVYGIIGGAGPVEFYEKAVGAVVIADSEPGIYTDLLR
jgi:predicted N-acetyltransferase YhbS